MKKNIFGVAALATVMLGFALCNSAPKANLETENDTLTYCYGVSTTRGLRDYLVRLDVDSTQMDAFIKGFLKATKELSASEKAEMVGMQIGQQVVDQMMPHFKNLIEADDSTAIFNEDAYLAGFIAGLTEDDQIKNIDEAITYIDEAKERQELKKYGAWKAENEEWLATNAGKEGVVTLPSGLQYEVLKAGKGAVPTAESRVKVHYHGTLIDGTVFDSSVERNQPAVFGVRQVIAGWTEALQLMPVGAKWRLYIPQQLAYGSREQRNIKPYSTLIFDVELLNIEK